MGENQPTIDHRQEIKVEDLRNVTDQDERLRILGQVASDEAVFTTGEVPITKIDGDEIDRRLHTED